LTTAHPAATGHRAPHRLDDYRLPLLAGAVAAACATLLVRIAPAGIDLAAHVYQRELLLQHGFVLWNNYWYAGRYTFVTYSVLYYPLAAILGIPVLAVGSIAVGAFAFALLASREWGAAARPASVAFALVWSGIVVSGAFPFALGFAFALLALVALQRKARVQMGALAALSLAASPLAFLFLVVIVVSAALARRPSLRGAVGPAAILIALGLVELLLRRLFPDPGRYPFPLASLAALAVFCGMGFALTVRVRRARLLCGFFVVYLVVASVAFVLPSQVGENIVRLRFAAVPIALLTLALRRWRPLLVGVIALALATSWNISPLAAFVAGGGDPTSRATFWQPAIRYLQTHGVEGYRAEVVDTTGHWGAVYLPDAGIPVARGWFRQDDYPLNTILYGQLGASRYLAWLHRLAVRYVVLPEGPLDYSARREARLVRSGRGGLRLVWHGPGGTIYAVPQPRALVSGPSPAKLIELGPTELRALVTRPGRYDIALRPSPYWRTSRGCLTTGSNGLLRLTVDRPGPVRLFFSITGAGLGDALVGERLTCHPGESPLASTRSGQTMQAGAAG
jgi:hypothetical protein